MHTPNTLPLLHCTKQRKGYGSLVHTPGFKHKRRVEGHIAGWRRVFWQGSTDHRGTPAAPGRTVTLAEDASAKTYGVAYELDGDADEVAETIRYLEWREKQYDLRIKADVLAADGAVAVRGALVYVATDSAANQNWLGPAPADAIARQIAHSEGPSGRNCDYVYRLADAMRRMQVDDAELFALEAAVRAHCAAAAAAGSGGDYSGSESGAAGEAVSAAEAELRRRHALSLDQRRQKSAAALA
jgi:cation transport regulator ChaC